MSIILDLIVFGTILLCAWDMFKGVEEKNWYKIVGKGWILTIILIGLGIQTWAL
jgi:hypothetical protein